MCRVPSFLSYSVLQPMKDIFLSSQWDCALQGGEPLQIYDEKNKQLVNEIYDMFVDLIFWNCWIHLNNKWDFLSDLSHENSCIPNTLIKGKRSVKDLICSERLTNCSANNTTDNVFLALFKLRILCKHFFFKEDLSATPSSLFSLQKPKHI